MGPGGKFKQNVNCDTSFARAHTHTRMLRFLLKQDPHDPRRNTQENNFLWVQRGFIYARKNDEAAEGAKSLKWDLRGRFDYGGNLGGYNWEGTCIATCLDDLPTYHLDRPLGGVLHMSDSRKASRQHESAG